MEVTGLLCKIGTNAKLYGVTSQKTMCVFCIRICMMCIVTIRLPLHITQNFLHRNTAMMFMAPLHSYIKLFQDNR
jgi:hypothetical protein